MRLLRSIAPLATVIALVAAPSAHAADAPTLDASGKATTALVNKAYQFDAGQIVKCPASLTGGCTMSTTVTALVHPAKGSAKLAVVGAGSAKIAAGASARVTARINMVGTQELRLRGHLRGKVAIAASGTVADSPATAPSAARFAGEQTITIPPLVVGADTVLKTVKLAPGQRLHLRLDGQNASTGHAWTVPKLMKGAALKMVGNTTVKDPSCEAGTVGCHSIRNFVFSPLKAGSTMVNTSLYGPEPETDAVIHINLKVMSVELPPAPRVLTFADSGKKIYLKQGQDLVVKLDGESASTGFSWVPMNVASSAGIKLAASRAFEETCAPAVVGCPSVREITYVQKKMANTKVTINLEGPSSDAPAQVFTAWIYSA